jgi:hypothetical protein
MFYMRFHIFHLRRQAMEDALVTSAKVRKSPLNADKIFFYTYLPIRFSIVILNRF